MKPGSSTQKIVAIARNTFGAFLRDKMLLLILAVLVCFFLLMLTPLIGIRAARSTMDPAQADKTITGLVEMVSTLVSACGSLLAVWAAADSVSNEMRSGTILAVLARPVRRWEFLLGKFAATEALLFVYVLGMLGMYYLLASLGGGHVQCAPWILIVYPMIRYSVYAALAMLLVTMMHPAVVVALFLILSTVGSYLSPGPRNDNIPHWLRAAAYSVMPSAGLLSESRFFRLNEATLITWHDHLTTIAYGADYAMVCFLLAVWSFRKRSLSRG